MAKRHEFNFAMTCEGCSNAAIRVLGKIGVPSDSIEVDLPNKKLYVTSDKPLDELLTAIAKTGKDVSHIDSKEDM